MTTGKLIVTTLGELIEDFRNGKYIDFRRGLAQIYAACVQAIEDDKLPDGSRKYSDRVRESFPYRVSILRLTQDLAIQWWYELWNWREMLTPHDFQTLNEERVVMSEVMP